MTLRSESSGGFGRTIGTILAVVLVVALGTWGYFDLYKPYHTGRNDVLTARQASADSTRFRLDSAQKVHDAELARIKDSTAGVVRQVKAEVRQDVRAGVAAALQQFAAAATVVDTSHADSTTQVDSLVPVATARTAVATLWTRDSSVIVRQGRLIDSLMTIDSLEHAGRVRADSIATTWQVKYTAEKAKATPKWESWALKAGEAVGVAVITRALVK